MSTRTYQINVDLDVFKALTARIHAEGHDHNDVLRELLNLDSPVETEILPSLSEPLNALLRGVYAGQFYSRGLILPDGTKLRARYKGSQHLAVIRNGRWWSEDGTEYLSPSAAASAITNTTVNGWRFWEGLLPGSNAWRRLEIIRNAYAHGKP
jgi:hypothetical protein